MMLHRNGGLGHVFAQSLHLALNHHACLRRFMPAHAHRCAANGRGLSAVRIAMPEGQCLATGGFRAIAYLPWLLGDHTSRGMG